MSISYDVRQLASFARYGSLAQELLLDNSSAHPRLIERLPEKKPISEQIKIDIEFFCKALINFKPFSRFFNFLDFGVDSGIRKWMYSICPPRASRIDVNQPSRLAEFFFYLHMILIGIDPVVRVKEEG